MIIVSYVGSSTTLTIICDPTPELNNSLDVLQTPHDHSDSREGTFRCLETFTKRRSDNLWNPARVSPSSRSLPFSREERGTVFSLRCPIKVLTGNSFTVNVPTLLCLQCFYTVDTLKGFQNFVPSAPLHILS